MPRIAFLTFSAPRGGPVSFLRRSCRYLAGRADVLLIDQEPEAIFDGIAPGTLLGVRAEALPIWSAPGRMRGPVFDRLSVFQPDWIVVNNPGLLVMYAGVLHRLQRAGAKVQYTIHSGMLTPTLRRRALELASSVVLAGADRITCVSDYTGRYIQRRYPWTRVRTIETIHHGVALPAVEPRPLRVPLHVGFVGRLIEEKDPQLFCEVAKAAAGRSFAFHVFGTGQMESALLGAYGSLVEFHGSVTEPADIFRDTDVLMMTSPIENCPNALLEAKSFAVPAIGARVGGIPELIEDGGDGALAARRTVDGFVAALERVAATYAQQSARCLVTRECFSEERHVQVMWAPLLGSDRTPST